MDPDRDQLAGRTILVTGASSGIGAKIAERLGELGATVIAHCGRNREGAEAATRGIPEERRLVLQADLADLAAVGRLWSDAVEWRGGVDVLVNNAAVMPQVGIEDSSMEWDDAWREVIAVNVVAPAELIRRATLHFLGRDGGVVITMSSWAAQQGSGNPKLAAYAASKASVAAVTKTVARAYAREGILGYCIAPGAVDTDMSSRSAANQGGRAAVEAALTMGEWVPPSEIADLVGFLASGTRRHLTGATFDVNGASYVR